MAVRVHASGNTSRTNSSRLQYYSQSLETTRGQLRTMIAMIHCQPRLRLWRAFSRSVSDRLDRFYASEVAFSRVAPMMTCSSCFRKRLLSVRMLCPDLKSIEMYMDEYKTRSLARRVLQFRSHRVENDIIGLFLVGVNAAQYETKLKLFRLCRILPRWLKKLRKAYCRYQRMTLKMPGGKFILYSRIVRWARVWPNILQPHIVGFQRRSWSSSWMPGA